MAEHHVAEESSQPVRHVHHLSQSSANSFEKPAGARGPPEFAERRGRPSRRFELRNDFSAAREDLRNERIRSG